MTARLPAVVTTDWLAAKLGTPGLRVVDGSWYLPGSGRDAATEYTAGHIPGAVFFDIDASSDPGTPLPHMLPTAERFAERMSALGLSDSDHVVVYDGSGVNLSAPRVWWTFRTFGHDRVSVLDGGINKWRREDRPSSRASSGTPPVASLPGWIVQQFGISPRFVPTFIKAWSSWSMRGPPAALRDWSRSPVPGCEVDMSRGA